MQTFDRYLLAQLLTFYGLFSVVLVFVAWINRAMLIFDQLIADGHSAIVFLEFSALTLPTAARFVLPVAAFGAAVYTAYRMRGDQELAVLQAAGMAPMRLARPLVLFGLIATASNFLVTAIVNPVTNARLDARSAELAQDVSAGILSDGEFLHPADGVTVFIREITPRRDLLGLYLRDDRAQGEETTYSAERGLLVAAERGPRLIMFNGSVQTFRPETGRLSMTRFEEAAFDVSNLQGAPVRSRRDLGEIGTFTLLRADPEIQAASGRDAGRLRTEAHERLAQCVVTGAVPIMGFAILCLGAHSRFGVWRQIVGAIGALMAIDTAKSFTFDMIRSDPGAWPVVYLPSLVALVIAALALKAGGGRAIPLLGRRANA